MINEIAGVFEQNLSSSLNLLLLTLRVLTCINFEILPLHLRVSEGPSRIEYQHRLDIKAARGRIQVDRTEPLSLDDYVL